MKKLLLILLAIFTISSLSAQEYSVKNYVFGSSAQTAQSADYTFQSTVGQSAIGIVQNANHNLSSGFWFVFIDDDNIITQIIPLISGWNLISGRIIPIDTDIETVFDDIIDNIVIVKDGNLIFIPGSINQIENWNYKRAYRVFASANSDLELNGTEVVPEDVSLSVPAGWSALPYLRRNSMLTKDAFNSIVDKVVIVKGPSGEVYIPGLLETMIMSPNKGYSIFLSNSTTYSYPAND